MGKRVKDQKALFEAATKSKQRKNFDGNKALRQLPPALLEGFQRGLRDIRIPEEGRSEFLDGFSDICHNQMFGLYQDNTRGPEEAIDDIFMFARLCMDSSVPGRYAKLLGSSKLLDKRFMAEMPLFVSGRSLTFEDVSEATISTARRIKDLANAGTEESARELIALLFEITSSLDWADPHEVFVTAATFTRNPELIRGIYRRDFQQDYEIAMQVCEMEADELFSGGEVIADMLMPYTGLVVDDTLLVALKQATFAQQTIFVVEPPPDLQETSFIGLCTRLGHIVLLSESENVIQHELQHLFDGPLNLDRRGEGDDGGAEYRAYLAAVAFPTSDLDVKRQFSECEKRQEYYLDALMDGKTPSAHESAANLLVERVDELIDLSRCMETAAELREAALRLLNEAYGQLVGITYDQILEPFRKLCDEHGFASTSSDDKKQ